MGVGEWAASAAVVVALAGMFIGLFNRQSLGRDKLYQKIDGNDEKVHKRLDEVITRLPQDFMPRREHAVEMTQIRTEIGGVRMDIKELTDEVREGNRISSQQHGELRSEHQKLREALARSGVKLDA